jgi:hypothetical protein
MSARAEVAQRVADFITENNLAQVYGGDVVQGKRYRSVGLSLARYLDGEVRIYGPAFIQVLLAGPVAHGEVRRVYATEDSALAFLRALLIDHDEDAAYAVPTKESA